MLQQVYNFEAIIISRRKLHKCTFLDSKHQHTFVVFASVHVA